MRFNSAFYKKAKRATPKEHDEGIAVLVDILTTSGIDAETGKKITIDTEIGERTYEPDVYAKTLVYKATHCLGALPNPTEVIFIVEGDGKSHDDSGGYQSRAWKDKVRDEAFLKIGVPTVRFDLYELVGEFKLSKEEIFKRIYHNGILASLNIKQQ